MSITIYYLFEENRNVSFSMPNFFSSSSGKQCGFAKLNSLKTFVFIGPNNASNVQRDNIQRNESRQGQQPSQQQQQPQQQQQQLQPQQQPQQQFTQQQLQGAVVMPALCEMCQQKPIRARVNLPNGSPLMVCETCAFATTEGMKVQHTTMGGQPAAQQPQQQGMAPIMHSAPVYKQ